MNNGKINKRRIFMQDILILILIPLFGVLIYAIVAFIFKRKNLFTIITAAVFVLIALYFYINSRVVQPDGFLALGQFLIALIVLYALIGYLAAWIIDYFFIYKKKNFPK
jgi:predicted Na+-dependent transporter